MPDTMHIQHFLDEELLVAARANQLEVSAFLISKGADVNFADENGATPLACASANGNLNLVTHLCEKGASVVQPGNNAINPLDAVLRGIADDPLANWDLIPVAVFLFSKLKEEVIARETYLLNENGTLESAIPIIKKVLAGDPQTLVDILYRDVMAAESSRVDFILSLAPTVGAFRQMETENSALHLLADRTEQSGHKIDDMAKKLIAHGSDVNARNLKGETPLHVAASRGWRTGLISILLEAGADPLATNNGGFTPYQCAGTRNNGKVLNAAQRAAELMAAEAAETDLATKSTEIHGDDEGVNSSL